MSRVLLTLAVLAVFALCLYGMWRGWQNRKRRQADLPEFPQPPADPGATVLETTGVYVGTTVGDDWQDRVAVGDVGHRAEATLRLTEQGVLVERTGASPLWIPAARVEGARTARGLAGKVMTADGLLVVRWQLGDRVLDTGFRGDDKDVYEQWVRALGGDR
ncbi:PH-like domain-containing protein [Saccharothrix syringae]|uniref:Transporter n=1 Tax=Saccharothrix syringae TaxID=103733 RepID=A0A5Q0H7X9_SACSY|nr:transporter [Saccharothrix syringae]QFZ22083.1 transporter [Saccharothrix syringae]